VKDIKTVTVGNGSHLSVIKVEFTTGEVVNAEDLTQEQSYAASEYVRAALLR